MLKLTSIRIIIILILFSCAKEDSEVHDCIVEEDTLQTEERFFVNWSGPQSQGFANGYMMDSLWSASVTAIAKNDSIVSISFKTYLKSASPALHQLSRISFDNMPMSSGCYIPINKMDQYQGDLYPILTTYIAQDHDVVEDEYVVKNEFVNRENRIELETINEQERKIYGRLAVTFERISEKTQHWWNPKVIRIYNCEFEVEY